MKKPSCQLPTGGMEALLASFRGQMIDRQCDEIRWLEFELLADCPIVHGTFMRHGGVSKGSFESLNFGKRVGDAIENVESNLKRASDALGVSTLISGRLVHGKEVAEITSQNAREIPLADALVTGRSQVGLMITQADCQAAIFYDPIHHALANVHCGWRGSVQNIYQATVDRMKQAYGSKPENLLVCISPSLGPENAEFIHYQTELPVLFWDFQTKPHHFDFWAIGEWQLFEAGVLPHHMQIARIDTYANDSDYFSYRRANDCGRQATICSLK